MASLLREAFSVTRLSFWTGALLSSIIGTSLYVFTQRSIESDARERFVNHVRYAQNVIGVRVKSYTDLLRGAASQIQSSDVLTHRQFHEYVRGLQLPRSFPAVEYINYAAQVKEADREAFMQTLGREVEAILGDRARPVITPPGIRPSYLIVTNIEPDPDHPRFFGFDLMANRYFYSQLVEERDRGTLFSAGTPIPVLSKPNNIYLGMRMPVYRMHAPLGSVAERRAAYRGSIGIAFSIPKLLKGVLDEIPVAGVRMTLYDTGKHMGPDGEDRSGIPFTLFDSHGTLARPAPPLDSGRDWFNVSLPLDFNGRPWMITYSVSKAALYTEFDESYPKMMMSFGFIGSLLLYALLFILTSSRRAALALAQEMTSELRESQSKLQLSHQKLRAWPTTPTRSRNWSASASRAKSMTTSARTCWPCASKRKCWLRARKPTATCTSAPPPR